MPFRLLKGARAWFQDVRPDMELDFDPFYFCLVAGLAARRKGNASVDDTAELVEGFPRPYQQSGKLILALFMATELEELGVSMEDRTAVHKAVRDLVSTETASKLSDLGMRELNRYSYGGYEVLREWFSDRPRTLETFLPVFRERVTGALGNRERDMT